MEVRLILAKGSTEIIFSNSGWVTNEAGSFTHSCISRVLEAIRSQNKHRL